MTQPDHYGLTVLSLLIRVECGDHWFVRDGKQEGPCICPTCGRRFVLTWNANVEPKHDQAPAPAGRYGVYITTEQREQIQSHMEQGELATAQGIILDILAEQFGEKESPNQAPAMVACFDCKTLIPAENAIDLGPDFGNRKVCAMCHDRGLYGHIDIEA